MSVKTLDCAMLSKMFLSGAKNLESKKEYINELNVFPVPDGDTGTNMTLTIMSAAKDVYTLENPDMATLCKSLSSGSLRGARGNSGVILSQLLRGFTKVIKEYDDIDVAIISSGFDKAVESAYKAVMKPKEGTILTVAKGAAEKANELFEEGVDDLDEFFQAIITYAEEVLAKTPDLLPVLKEAGVVDSGGQGLVEFLKGAYSAFIGKEIEFTMDDSTAKTAGETRMLSTESVPEKKETKGYNVEYTIVLGEKLFNIKHENDFIAYLEGIGESVSVNTTDEKVSVKVQTNDPGLALQKGLKIGQLTDINIKNLILKDTGVTNNSSSESVIEEPAKNDPPKEVGFITVCAGSGIADVFRNLGADYIIEGGQTMNPSTEDMLNAIEKVNAENVFILPNNKNIILAANQAMEMTKDKRVIVIPTKTIPQGISALISFVPEISVDENIDSMIAETDLVKTGQVTYAVRDTVIDGCEIHQDDYMGIGDNGILSNGKDIKEVVKTMLSKMVADDTELITIYYGSDVNEADANALKDELAIQFDQCDIELQDGGQPIYYYIISAE